MYLAMLTLPLLGSIFSGFFGRKVGVCGDKFTTFTLRLQSLLNRAYSSLDWFLDSTPKTYAFVILPFQISTCTRLFLDLFKSNKMNISLTILGLIILLLSLNYFFSLLGLMYLLPIVAAFYKSNITINNALNSTVLTFFYILYIYVPGEWFNIVSILILKLYLC